MEESNQKGKAVVPVDMKSNRLKYHRRRAKNFMIKADKALSSRTLTTAPLLKFETAATFYFQASISFRVGSNWRDAGDALVKCAVMHHLRLRRFDEAAALYTEAAEIFLKIDKNDSITNFRSAVSLYCDLSQFDVAGILQRRIAEIQAASRHWDEAANSYHKAADFLAASAEQSDYCFEKCAECLIEDGKYGEASEIFLIIAESCAMSNLRFFNARDKLFRSILCSMAEAWLYSEEYEYHDEESDAMKNTVTETSSAFNVKKKNAPVAETEEGKRKPSAKYETIKSLIIQYESVDCTWKCSKESLFLWNIVKTRENFDMDAFADHVYYWNSVQALDRIDIMLLSVVHKEIEAELKRRLDEINSIRHAIEKKKRIRARLAKKKQNMKERGLDPNSISEADILDEEDEEEASSRPGTASRPGTSVAEDQDEKEEGEGEGEGGSEDEDEEDDEVSDLDVDLPSSLLEPPPPPRKKREKKK